MKPVTLEIRFADLFAKGIPQEVRRARWEEWKRMAIESGAEDCVEYWTDISACLGCSERDGDWCSWGLPCTVNPLLSFKYGMIGMACIGLGFTPNYSTIKQGVLA
jgi:hypothetical protein